MANYVKSTVSHVDNRLQDPDNNFIENKGNTNIKQDQHASEASISQE